MTILGRNWERKKLPDGQTQLTIYQKPIAYEKNGVLKHITNILDASGDPVFPVGVDELVQFRIKDKLAGESPIIHFGKGQTHVRITPLNTNNVTGIVSGNSITYPEAWDNADFRATVAGHLVELDAPLKTGHPETFAFRLNEHQGLDLETLSTADFCVLQPLLRNPNAAEGVPLQWVVTESGGKTLLTVTLPEGDWTGWVLDPTLTLQPDAAAGLDTFIFSDAPTTNWGTNIVLAVGDNLLDAPGPIRSLIEFGGLSAIPVTSIISSVTFSAFENFASDTEGVGTWAVNLQRALRDWVEIQATWNIYSTGNNWGTAGCSQDAVDRIAAVSASVVLDGVAANAFINWTGATLIADVQSIVNGDNANHGWLLSAPAAESKTGLARNYFASSDHLTALERPKLVVVYTTPPRPCAIIFQDPGIL